MQMSLFLSVFILFRMHTRPKTRVFTEKSSHWWDILRYATPNYYITTVSTMYCVSLLLHFRKMQEGDVGASNSDLLTDKADDDDTHMPER